MATARAQARFLLGAIALFAVLSYLVIKPYLGAIVLGLIAAYLLHGPYERLAGHMPARLAASLMVLLTLALIVAPVVAVGVIFFEDIMALPSTLRNVSPESYLARGLKAVGLRNVDPSAAMESLSSGLQAWSTDFAARSVVGVFHFFIGLFIFLFLLFFGLLQGRSWVDFVRRAIPLDEHRTERLVRETGRSIDAIFRGELLVALVQGVVAGIGWWLFGLPSPIIWAFVMTILAILPWVGPTAVMAPAGIFLIVQGELVKGILVIVYAVALVGLVDNFLRPIVIGKRGKIHAAVVLVGIVGGLMLFGLVGLFLGPLILSLLRVFLTVWTEDNEIRAAS